MQETHREKKKKNDTFCHDSSRNIRKGAGKHVRKYEVKCQH